MRINAIFRRMNENNKRNNNKNKIITCGNLILDYYTFNTTLNNTIIKLRPKEFDLLKLFMESPGKVFNREELLDLIWKINIENDYVTRTVDTHVYYLRTKLETSGFQDAKIATIKNRGYKWEVALK